MHGTTLAMGCLDQVCEKNIWLCKAGFQPIPVVGSADSSISAEHFAICHKRQRTAGFKEKNVQEAAEGIIAGNSYPVLINDNVNVADSSQERCSSCTLVATIGCE